MRKPTEFDGPVPMQPASSRAAATPARNARKKLLSMLPTNAIGAEIGVWRGDFSADILSSCNPNRLYLIDPWIIQSDEAHAQSRYGRAQRVDMDNVHNGV